MMASSSNIIMKFLHFTLKLNVVIAFALLSCTCSGGIKAKHDGSSDSLNNEKATRADIVTLAFTGDVMMGTNFPKDYITPDRGKTLFQDCSNILRDADVAIVNLEGTCYDGTDGELRKMTNPNTYYIFRTPGDHACHLSDAGVDAVNMANNHSFDFGVTGRKNTIKTMEGVGIKVAGLREMSEYAVIERNGIKFVYLGFAASCTDVLDMLDYNEVDSMIDKCSNLGDVLIVSFHGGAEGTANQHVPRKTEYYVGENRGNVYEFAHHCIDKGADIVIGHGPHVPRAMELYNGHLIAYSLGNFCAPYRLGTGGATGLAPLLQVKLNVQDGKFVEGQIYSFKQYSGIGPRTDSTNAAAALIRNLTLQDFADTMLNITTDGKIQLK